MTDRKGTDGLARYRESRTGAKVESVNTAIHSMLGAGEVISVSAVARHAGVSRAFIHAHSSLHKAVQSAHREELAGSSERARQSVSLAESASRTAERLTLLAEIARNSETVERLRAEIDRLKHERAKWFGHAIDEKEYPEQEVNDLRDMLSQVCEERDRFKHVAEQRAREISKVERKWTAVRLAYRTHLQNCAADETGVRNLDLS